MKYVIDFRGIERRISPHKIGKHPPDENLATKSLNKLKMAVWLEKVVDEKMAVFVAVFVYALLQGGLGF